MIARTGIGFSNKTTLVSPEGMHNASAPPLESLVDNIPALKCSLYFGMKEYSSSPASAKDLKNLAEKANLSDIYHWDIHRFYEELSTIHHFKGIISMQNEY